ncbi:DUF4438 domain-containing protein [Roseobacter sp. HKCCD9010]|uniref:DUF4438 domain-containing protein n=1 Tax=unclassified Roseobacter TaxID=196798 RepID=UPI0014922589|nr:MULTISPECIES: DUF4438 domain-containing protein [unclassified Roseobacter]MBF9049831.1 DUF4438 domain-containing protein [Rhodobacterales bacterium HKCCD4356]NNV13630.1 DUF4438 domain-containing protein [Roseobacter sp. HKCCD7357]NNV16464.1 DUF4438 domain-containing protein [Roseobacter sp. HKCCD8768]NNV25923.1 DUF4438 domain-containing protein [Roseobacter sp. HKCCD8192]NNV30181.1 DUF4438 domain-containing protein [Roseobacter sp. HKCCD9061]
MSLQTNAADIVTVSVMGQVANPSLSGLPAEPYRLDADGKAFLWPTFGGIVYNVTVGDSAFGWSGDCIHPSVSIAHPDANKNRGLNVFACVGNEAMIVSGAAKGARGVVTGKSGRFSDQVIIHFDLETRRKIAVDDQILVKSEGVGLTVLDCPEVSFKSLSPALFDALPKRLEDGVLKIGVCGTVPPHFVGAGAGLTSEGGSLHIQSTDRAALAKHGLDNLRLGDVVAIQDTDSRYNHGYLRGAMSIGIVGQTDGPRAGYGPGMTVVMTAPSGQLGSFEAPGTNIADILELSA